MKNTRIGIVSVILLLTFTTAFAASNSTEITLGSAATVAGNKLAPGTYKVTWTGQGDNINVTLKNRNAEVKATAQAVKNDTPISYTSFVTNKDGELTEIRPAGKSTSIRFTGGENASVKASSSSSNP